MCFLANPGGRGVERVETSHKLGDVAGGGEQQDGPVLVARHHREAEPFPILLGDMPIQANAQEKGRIDEGGRAGCLLRSDSGHSLALSPSR